MSDDGAFGLYTADAAEEWLTETHGTLVEAIKATHPDRGGDAEQFRKVMREGADRRVSFRCEHCRKLRENVRLREKTDARTFKPIRLRLCTPCARDGGWVDVTFDRGHTRSLA